MSCNSESRRVINYSLKEPINNKYDLWLSENLRYNSEGVLVYDSPGQPACDLILKIYKDGDWKPIAGLSTEHIVANKINIVNGVNYTYISPNDNIYHINNGFLLNHLPLFRNPQDSPNELFDAGTLGEAIYGFVNETEWENIFEGDAFNNSFKLYFPTIINNGDININDFIELATTRRIGGILSDTHESLSVYAFKPVEVKFYPNTWHNDLYNGRLSINAWDVQEALNEIWQEHPGSEIISGWKGIETLLRDGQQGIWVGLSGVTPENTGRFCTVQLDNTDPSRASIEWVDLPEILNYSLLGPSSSALEKYVVKGGGKVGEYLDYEGNWTKPALVEGNGINTFVINSKIYVRSYTCIINEEAFVLDPSVNISDSYSDSHYPFVDFTDYRVDYPNGISNITIQSDNTPYLQYPSYMHFTTSTKCIFTFPKGMEFIETESVNSSSGEDYYYTDTDYIIELKQQKSYIVTFYKSCIKFETNSNSIFDTKFTSGI